MLLFQLGEELKEAQCAQLLLLCNTVQHKYWVLEMNSFFSSNNLDCADIINLTTNKYLNHCQLYHVAASYISLRQV